MEFKDKLRKLRTDAGLSQEALADIIHISRSAIAKYENGNGNPSEDTLKALAFYFGVDVNELKSDTVIKDENRRKMLIKLSMITSCVVLAVGIIIILIIGIIHLNNRESTGDEELKVTNANTEIGLYAIADNVLTIQDGDNTYYQANTFLTFTIIITPTFNQENDNQCEIIFGKQDFAYIYLDQDQEKTCYIIEFRKEGKFQLFYSILDYTSSIRFICDDTFESWDKYKHNLADFHPWVRNLEKENITSLRYEFSNSSLGPSHFRDIYYSKSDTDIASAYDFLSSTVYYSNSKYHNTPGETYKTITYYFSNSLSQSISMSGNHIAITSAFYIASSSFKSPTNYDLHCFGFNVYSKEISAVNIADETELKISYFYDLEFIPWPSNEAYDIIEPVYYILGYIGEDRINVYNYDRFSYLGNMYKIVSKQNFIELFC